MENASSREEVEEIAYNLADEYKARNIKQSIVGSSVGYTKRLHELQQKCIETYKDPYLLFKFKLTEQTENKYNVILSDFKENKFIKSEWTSQEKENNYVLKSSKEKLKLLTEVMQAEDLMGKEYIYMDFKENRIVQKEKNMKTLGLSVYHVILKKVVLTVRMDCETENKDSVSFFLKSIDEMLQHYSNQRIEEFRPASGWMLDEGGGLHTALEENYGLPYCQDNVVTFQMHLTMCRNRHSSSAFIGDTNKQGKIAEFRKNVNTLVHANTINEYNDVFNELREFIPNENKPALMRWLLWWDKRRSHVMDAYRDTTAPNTNLAEVSHASTSHCGGSSLNILQTAIFDISDSFKYSQSVKGYSSGIVKSGSGPSKSKQEILLEQKSMKRMNALMSELDNQFKGGKAPTQATSSTFEDDAHSFHRADKGPTAVRRPIGKKRTSVSKEFTSSMEKAKQLFGYKCIDITVNSPMQATVTLVSDAGDIYSIQFDQKASCSCPYSTLQKTERTGCSM